MPDFSFDAYVFFKLTGIIWFILATYFVLGRYKIHPIARLIVPIFVTLCGFYASKIWYILQHALGSEPYPYDQFVEAWRDAGSVLYGWILGGSAAVWAVSLLFKLSTLSLLDSLLPAMLVAQILNRLGCFSAGCCWGSGPCNLPWAVLNENAGNIRVHPVQIYEAIFDALLLAGLLAAKKSNKKGKVTFLYFMGYAVGRFFLEYVRGDNLPAFAGLTVAQLASFCIIFILLIMKKKIV